MSLFTRRRFLVGGTTAGVAAAVVAASRALPLAGVTPTGAAAADRAPITDPIVLQVRDLRTGEVSLMVGTSETVYRDQDLVNRLVAAASRAGATTGA